MSSLKFLSVLLAVLLSPSLIVAEDEDFAFEVSDDFEIDFPQETLKKHLNLNDQVATVGQVFHFTIPAHIFDQKVTKYNAKSSDGLLPSWLLFEKSSGSFWGIPLKNDIQTFHVSVQEVLPQETKPLEFKLTVKDFYGFSTNNCSENEDITLLTLVINKSLSSIKPKQRVLAINYLAKFFGLPHSAFHLSEDRTNGKSGNLVVLHSDHVNSKKQNSKSISLIQVPVGCDSRIWVQIAPLIHQLKKQMKDGTISGITKLPVVEWKIVTQPVPVPVARYKRFVDENGGPAGSGDYDDYEYDYDGEEYDDNEGDEETSKGRNQGSVTKLPLPSSTFSAETETHPHRHHHGETKPIDDEEPEIRVVKVPTLGEPLPTSPVTEETKHQSSPSYSTAHYTTDDIIENKSTRHQDLDVTESSSVSALPSSVYTSEEVTDNEPTITKSTNIYRPIDVPEEDDYGDDYDDTTVDTEDEEDEEDVTEVPTEALPSKPTKVDHVSESSDRGTSRVEGTSPGITVTNPHFETTQFEQEITPVYTTTAQENVPVRKVETLDSGVFLTNSTTSTTPLPSIEITLPSRTTIIFDDLTTSNDNLTTITKHSTQRQTTVTEGTVWSPTTTIISTTVVTSPSPVPETTMIELKNFPPTIQNRLNSIAVTAGKIFEYSVPENTFNDIEDGNNLKLELLDHEGNPVNGDSWCQFNARERKIYGLPIEDDVSGWEYILKATDNDGASVSDRLKIRVHHHKSRRVVNHEFSLHVFVEKKYEFSRNVDWALRIIKGLGTLYSQSNLSDIIVRRIEHDKEPMVLTWTNDSLPKNFCPRAEILNLYSILTSNDRGDPSKALSLSLAPEIRVKRVTHRLLGICESQPPAPSQPTNFSPILRNAVDHINATIGELLVYKVPDDTFYDPEDVDGHNLKMTLLTSDHKSLPADNWLQFDSKNREFYGIPLPKDIGRTEYALICEDSGGLTATDSLVIVVHSAPRINYNIEFSMAVETEYETFATSPSMQRKFIEKLRDLFEDRDTNHIHLSSISKGSTIISWYNKSLPTSYCPKEDIRRLESVLIYNDRSINSRVYDVMRPEFSVSRINFQSLGACKSKPIVIPATSETIPSPDDASERGSNEEYLVTFIVPAVIIVAMLLLAGIAACILYRRRRSGKMNVEEDGRQSYGNKGIPVIFQEELEEKPDPGTKAPVILKDEKPPLAPPEYSKSGSLKMNDDSEPYHPPPPFARTQDNGKQSRPKPTPTYRKPPPYVPP